jgi:hypothetical protein
VSSIQSWPAIQIHLFHYSGPSDPLETVNICDQTLVKLRIPHADELLFPCTFEALAASLSKLERLYFEPDGSFVWSGNTQSGRWQMDGMIYDVAERVQRVEASGSLPLDSWHLFLDALECPRQSLVAQWVPLGCFVPVGALDVLW